MFRRPAARSAPLAPRRPDPDRQCHAISTSTKAQCERWAVAGGTFCPTHRADARRTPAARAVTASASTVRLETTGWQTWRFGSSAWQREAWRLYDITGQLRFVAGWAGNSVSRCRLYVADVDEAGEVAGETEDTEVAALASGPLGSGPAKDEALRLLGINLFVPGEAYIVAESGGNDDGTDRWFVVAGQQIRRMGDEITIRRSQLQGGGDMVYRPDTDLIIRVWTPHPADPDQPDSPTRSAIPDLKEIEALRKREFAELDSRLTGAGLLLLSENMDFPAASDDDPPGAEGFVALLQRTMATSLKDRASAEAMVPIIATGPAEDLQHVRLITFWSELSGQLLALREAAIRSLAQSLDVPAEILLGLAESNHWSAWLISDEAVTTQVVPLLSRIADALSTGYLRAAVEALGKDPDRYVYAFDVAPLTTRPNRASDALNYHGQMLISDEAALEAGAFRPDEKPGGEEILRRLVTGAVQGAPSTLADPVVQALLAQLLGVTLPSPPPAPAVEPAPGGGGGGGGDTPPPGPAPVRDPESPPEEPPQTEQDMAALAVVANLAVRRALTLAGSRLVPHPRRDRCATARHDLHTCHGPVPRDRADHVLRGAWDDLAAVADDLHLDPVALEQLLHGFALELLTRGMAYDPALLRDLVSAAVRGRRLTAPVGVGAS